MYQDILEKVGLSPNEARIYEALVERGEINMGEIATIAKVHRRNAYDAVRRLVDKGLCFEIVSQKGSRYNAVDPDKLLELYSEREKELQKALPELRQKFSKRTASEEAYIYRGYEGQKNIWREILRAGAPIYNIGAKAQWLDPALLDSRTAFFDEANRKKIEFNLLLDNEVRVQMPDFVKNYPGKILKYRYLPKEYSTNSIANIFGDYVVTYTGITVGKMQDDTAFFVIKSQDLAESYRRWFQYMWNQSSK